MSGSGSAAGLRVLARLLLWLAVLVGGFLYLGAIDDRRENGGTKGPPSADGPARGVADSPAGAPLGKAGVPPPAPVAGDRQRSPGAAPEVAGAGAGGSAGAALASSPGGSAEPARSENRSAGAAAVVAQATGAADGERPQQGAGADPAAPRSTHSDLTPAEATAFARAVISDAVSDAGAAYEPPTAAAEGPAAPGEGQTPPPAAAAMSGSRDNRPSRATAPAPARGPGMSEREARRWRAYREALGRRHRGPWPGWHIPYPPGPPSPRRPRWGP
jgi:hypothetical protein